MTFIIPTEAIVPATPLLVGGKAAGCGFLFRKNLAVPKGFVISNCAYHLFMAEHQLNQPFQQLIQLFTDSHNENELQQACADFQMRIRSLRIPAAIIKELTPFLDGFSEVSVRSSALVEDGLNHAFAGVFHTELNVAISNIEKAIISCWSEAFSYATLTYTLRNNIDPLKNPIALLVQEMLNPDYAGVIFTEEPSGNSPTQGLISFTEGLADKLMDGEDLGHTFYFERDSHKLNVSQQQAPIDLFKQLIHIAMECEQSFSHPQDIEWAIVNNELFFLQIRPITSLKPKKDKPIIWSRELSEERFPLPISELGWSVMEDVFQTNLNTLAERFGIVAKSPQDVACVINNYVYSNEQFFAIPDSLNINIKKQLPFLPLYFKESLIATSRLPQLLRKPLISKKLLFIIHGFKAFIFPHAEEIQNNWDAHLNTVLKKLQALNAVDVSDMDNHGLLGYKSVFNDIADEYMEPDLAIYIVKTACEWLIGEIGAELGYSDKKAFLAELTQGVVDNITLRRNAEFEDFIEQLRNNKETITLLQNKQFEQALASFNEEQLHHFKQLNKEFGHVTANWDIKSPTWGEDNNNLLALLASLSMKKNAQDFRANQQQHSEQYQQALARLNEKLAEHSWLSDFFHQLLSVLHEFMRLDEEHNFHCARLFPSLRKLYRKAGEGLAEQGILSNQEDIFFLTVNEIDVLLKQENNFTRHYVTAARKANYERALTQQAAHKYIDQAPIIEAQLTIQRDGNTIVGTAASPGTATGKVKIIETPQDLQQFEAGDILVTTSPKPAWTPLYAVAGALITATGSTLSHGLISAREYRLPAVIGIPNVINELSDGQIVHVNGDIGSIVCEE